MTTRAGRSTAPSARRIDLALLKGTLLPRLFQMLLGGWLVATVFIWPHTRVQSMVTLSAGVLTLALAVVSLWVRSFRLLLGLAGGWLLVGTATSSPPALTLVHNVAVALLIIGLSFAPRSAVPLFGGGRQRTA